MTKPRQILGCFRYQALVVEIRPSRKSSYHVSIFTNETRKTDLMFIWHVLVGLVLTDHRHPQFAQGRALMDVESVNTDLTDPNNNQVITARAYRLL